MATPPEIVRVVGPADLRILGHRGLPLLVLEFSDRVTVGVYTTAVFAPTPDRRTIDADGATRTCRIWTGITRVTYHTD